MGNFGGVAPFLKIIGGIVFWYPYVMSLVWIAGSLLFSHYLEKKRNINFDAYTWPAVSILLPCYNEEDTVKETIKHLSRLSYPNFEIVAVNDGSSDNTGKILKGLVENYECLRVIDCHENRGKANALHMAAHASKNEYLICIDSDAILDDDAPYYLIRHFLEKGERVGAVTGNPRIRNRDTILSRLQLVEYSSIIGSIKRTQRILGKVMTVSGVIVAFRKKALVSVGLWDRDMITEDIAISWKLQRNFWDIRYEPNALCWMLVPETLSGLWNQRVRWAQGGQEIILRHWDVFKDWRQRRLWPIYIEQVLSIIWAFMWFFFTIYFIIVAHNRSELVMVFTFSSFALAMLSFIQLFISMKNESTYDKILKYYIWAAWYPTMYWIINAFVAISALPKAIKSTIKGGYAVWTSPDRGDKDELEDDIKDVSSVEEVKQTPQSKLIIKSKQHVIKRLIGYVFSLSMWFYMFIVFDLFISACIDYNEDYIGILRTSFKVTNEDIREFIGFSLILFCISFIILFVWKIYNKKHFGGLNRRKQSNQTTDEEMLSLGLIESKTYEILQREKIIVFDKNPVKDL